MKQKSETITIRFDVTIHYSSAEGREAAIKEASKYFKKVSSSQGYWINADITGSVNEITGAVDTPRKEQYEYAA